MHSQNDEEKYILEYFKDRETGRFLDLGAYNGKTDSNTHALALKGWTGLCVEASAKPFNDLMQLYKDNDRIELINAMIVPDTEDARFLSEFYDAGGDAISTYDTKHKAKWEADRNYRQVWMQPIYMSSIERRFGADFDFINIDLEGISFDVFDGILAWGFDMLCIKHDNETARIKQIKEIFSDFDELYRNGENLILARKVKDG
jgi:FkbM family methyltransferase